MRKQRKIYKFETDGDISVENMEQHLPLPENPSWDYLKQTARNKQIVAVKVKEIEELNIEHSGHNILGHYCWDCKKTLVAGIPYWGKPYKNEGPKISQPPTDVVWKDGSHDDSRTCSYCDTRNCTKRTHNEFYKDQYLTSIARNWERENPVV